MQSRHDGDPVPDESGGHPDEVFAAHDSPMHISPADGPEAPNAQC